MLKDLEKNKISHFTGHHSVFINNRKDLLRINPSFSIYPKDCGLKIILSSDFTKDKVAYYLSSTRSTRINQKMVGDLLERQIVQNTFSTFSISPKVYDVIYLRLRDKIVQAMILQNISGKIYKGYEQSGLVGRIKNISISENIYNLNNGFYSIDFRPPNFNKNIIQKSDNKLVYVDVQNFTFKNRLKNIIDLEASLEKFSSSSTSPSSIKSGMNNIYEIDNFDSIVSSIRSKFNNSLCFVAVSNPYIILQKLFLLRVFWCTVFFNKKQESFPQLVKKGLYFNGYSRFTIESDLMNTNLKFPSSSLLICDKSTINIDKLSAVMQKNFSSYILINYNKKDIKSISLDKNFNIINLSENILYLK